MVNRAGGKIMVDPKKSEQKIELYTYYLMLGVIALFIFTVLILVLHFVVGLLLAISMGG